MNVMQPAQVQCPGCERVFTPSGLSKHLSKIDDFQCHHIVAASQTHLASMAFPCMAPPLTLSLIWASQIAGGVTLGNLDEYSELTQGEFTVTRVATHAAIL
jgi:hypothetical protein